MQNLYETDEYAWKEESAKQMRELSKQQTIPHFTKLFEESASFLEEMAAGERRELSSQLVRLMLHLLKWKYQPDRQTRSWRNSIDDARDEIELSLRRSLSLKSKVYQMALDDYDIAVRKAKKETGLHNAFPEELEFSLEQLLDYDFLP